MSYAKSLKSQRLAVNLKRSFNSLGYDLGKYSTRLKKKKKELQTVAYKLSDIG